MRPLIDAARLLDLIVAVYAHPLLVLDLDFR